MQRNVQISLKSTMLENENRSFGEGYQEKGE